MDKIHDSDQTALLRQALELFENCGLAPGVLAEIHKVVPPHRPPTRKAPKVSREQIVLDMKKKLEKEEQELRERKIALDQARRLVTEREQKVMDQATTVSALKMELVELRQGIANNPTRGGTERGGGALAAQGGDVEDGPTTVDAPDIPFSRASRAIFR